MRHLMSFTIMAVTIAGLTPAAAKEAQPGYLAQQQAQAAMRMMPPPPAKGRAQDMADRAAYRQAGGGVGGPAWQRAIGQFSTNNPEYLKQFSCAVGVQLSPLTTPNTMAVLRRAAADAAPVVGAAKDFYRRPRPFQTDRGAACDPQAAVGDGSKLGFAYPSGHATTGALWGLILADALPARRAAALKFGKETGDLRVACRVHWPSDVAAGQAFGAALYKQIAAQGDYKADIAKARAELAKADKPLGCPAG